MRDAGYYCQVVERYNQYSRRRLDLFNFIDIVCVHPEKTGVVGIQVTTTGHLNERIKKAKDLPEYSAWISAGNTAAFHGWAKRGKAGKRKLWTLKEVINP